MADQVSGGSVKNTALVGISSSSAIVVANFLVQPHWPPPQDVIIIVVGYIAPLVHLVGRGIYRKVADWAGEPVPLSALVSKSGTPTSPSNAA